MIDNVRYVQTEITKMVVKYNMEKYANGCLTHSTDCAWFLNSFSIYTVP